MSLAQQLYLALQRLAKEYKGIADSGDSGNWSAEEVPEYQQAMEALQAYELTEHEPLPEWAVGINEQCKPMIGAQLCTKDGRRMGNAHIMQSLGTSRSGCDLWSILTDAGNWLKLTSEEIEELFHIGKWLSNPEEVKQRFDRK